MKKRILTWMLALITSISTSYAAGIDGGTENAKASFRKDFGGAEVIRWDNSKAFSKATFRYNGQVMFAYYSIQGHLMAVGENILSDRLPLVLEISLKKNYSDYWVTDLFEVVNDGETSYYVTLENPDYVLILKSSSTNGWEIYTRTKKASE